MSLDKFAPRVGTTRACQAFGVKPRTYRHRRRAQARSTPEERAAAAKPEPLEGQRSAPAGEGNEDREGNKLEAEGDSGKPAPKARRLHPAALTINEKQLVLDTLCSDAYCDMPPAQVFNTLLDEGSYLCSVRHMYRLLEEHGLSHERRRGGHQRRGLYPVPLVEASRPNQGWSWDITKLKGPEKGVRYFLYTILDIYSRCVVGWAVHTRESEEIATTLVRKTIEREGINSGELVLHADRGSPMTARNMIELLEELGVRRSHSRPRVSNDNPFSESQFKTMKYHSTFPDGFGSLEDARAWCRAFFDWYNHVHYHSGIAYLRPSDLHAGRHNDILEARQATLNAAHAAHPQRFNRKPTTATPPTKAWINKPVIYTA